MVQDLVRRLRIQSERLRIQTEGLRIQSERLRIQTEGLRIWSGGLGMDLGSLGIYSKGFGKELQVHCVVEDPLPGDNWCVCFETAVVLGCRHCNLMGHLRLDSSATLSWGNDLRRLSEASRILRGAPWWRVRCSCREAVQCQRITPGRDSQEAGSIFLEAAKTRVEESSHHWS